MKDKSGIISLTITAFICVCLIIAGGIYVGGKNFPQAAKNRQTVTEYVVSPPKADINVTESQKAVSTAANADAVGKVVAKFISPYNSKNQYNRVYVKNNAGIELDISKYLSKSNPVKLEKNGKPQILIMHTHTTECYLPEDRDYYTDGDLTRTRDKSKNVTAVGDIITQKLNDAGFVTLHDTTEHDYPQYDGSYNRSGETVKKYLKEYPSIKIVIDLHRDSLKGNGIDRVKPVVEIQGKKAAQVMLVIGCGENISGHENWEKNFTFGIKYHQTLEVLYPGLARPISFSNARYNQHLTSGSILLEVGTESSSLDEAKYGGELAANALVAYLNTLV